MSSAPLDSRVIGPMQTLVESFVKRGQTLGTAESCTGGLFAATLASIPGISTFYQGTIVSYANQVKSNLLGVSEEALVNYGAVSLPVVTQMARGARNLLRCDWVLSISGVAGPGGGTSRAPVGFICFGVCGPSLEYTEEQQFEGERKSIQWRAVQHGAQLLLKCLK